MTTSTRDTLTIGALTVQGVIVLTGLLTAFGVPLTVDQLAAITSAAGFAGIVLTLWLRSRTVGREVVLEQLVGDTVVAGEANDMLPAGAQVRTVEPRHAADEGVAA